MTRSTQKLSEVARHLVYPDGIVTTGWPAIKQRLADMSIHYDGWQEGVSQLILGRDDSGRYVATVGGVTMSLPRQVGKTFTIGSLLVAMCVEYPGLRVVWTSHHLRTTTNTFRSMQSMVRKPAVFALLDRNGIRTANGEQEIRFANGSLIMFGAREHGFGVGIDAIDILVCDEAQRLTSRALADMVPTTNQSRHEHGALMFFIGTPPRPDNAGDEFAARRRKALDGKMRNGIYVEMSADEDGDYNDPRQWMKANASYPHRTPDEAMQRMRENLTDEDDWRREAMGVWDAEGEAAQWVIPEDIWRDAEDVHDGPRDGQITLALDSSPRGDQTSVAACARRPDGKWQVELVYQASGVAWVPAWLKEQLQGDRVRGVVFDEQCSALMAIMGDLTAAGVRPTLTKWADMKQACSGLMSGVVEGSTKHSGQQQLTYAVSQAGKRESEGGWAWSRRNSSSDITPVVAITLAHWGARNQKLKKPERTPSGGRGYVTRKRVGREAA